MPEVETIVNQLRKILVSKKITQIEIFDETVVDRKIASVVPFMVKGVYRRGKSIIFDIGYNRFLLTHLRMTGHFYHVTNSNDNKHKNFIAAKFHLYDGSFLTHNSIRKFGSIKLLSLVELNNALSKLGPEPLEIGEREFYYNISKYPNSIIKTKLMEQSFLAGIGNIYAQEALYHAGIDPRKKISNVTEENLIQLCQEIKRILKLAIKNKGSTVDNYTNLSGGGSFQNMLAVYGKRKCPFGHSVEEIKLGGRGTNYCPVCQK